MSTPLEVEVEWVDTARATGMKLDMYDDKGIVSKEHDHKLPV